MKKNRTENNLNNNQERVKVYIRIRPFNDAEMKLGVGETRINAKLLGSSKINAGIGLVNLVLIESGYEIDIDKGIGEVKYNGSKASDDLIIGNGENKISIYGGIGDIRITIDVLAE